MMLLCCYDITLDWKEISTKRDILAWCGTAVSNAGLSRKLRDTWQPYNNIPPKRNLKPIKRSEYVYIKNHLCSYALIHSNLGYLQTGQFANLSSSKSVHGIGADFQRQLPSIQHFHLERIRLILQVKFGPWK